MWTTPYCFHSCSFGHSKVFTIFQVNFVDQKWNKSLWKVFLMNYQNRTTTFIIEFSHIYSIMKSFIYLKWAHMGIIKSKKNKVRIWENKLDLFLPSEPLIPSMHFFFYFMVNTRFFSAKNAANLSVEGILYLCSLCVH